MKNGLIITQTSRKLPNGLTFFDGQLWTPERTLSALSPLVKSAEDAVAAFLDYYDASRIGWLSGAVATKALARKFGLEYRKRAPGAGRPKKEPGKKAVFVGGWMAPDEVPTVDAAQRKIGARSRGAAIVKMAQLVLDT
jgi:hypothetical protein